MYDWRNMTEAERASVLCSRRRQGLPWHSPPHFAGESETDHLVAANYEHQPVLSFSPTRMTAFERDLLQTLTEHAAAALAWCILPNHYHVLLHAPNFTEVLGGLGKLHGRTSHTWNGEENCRGRQCWNKHADRSMRSEGHQWATLNYIHHNPVRHGYVSRWQDWPYSSALGFLEKVGHKEAERIWRAYPVLDYGKGWDDPKL